MYQFSHSHSRGARGRRFTPLATERLEDRFLLAVVADSPPADASDAPLVAYQVRVVAPGGALFERSDSDPGRMVPTADLTSIRVGDSYDLAVTVVNLQPGLGVFAGYLDIGYDSSRTQVQVAEIQRLHLEGAAVPTPASGSFRLAFGDQTTEPIAISSNPAVVAPAVQAALSALPSIGPGNIEVRAVPGGFVDVHFVGKFLGHDVPNMVITEQNLTGGTAPRVWISYEGDLHEGIGPLAFQEAFRSLPGPTATSAIPYYENGLFAESLPSLINDVGAFATGTSLFPGQLSPAEVAAGLTVAPPRELVRARLVATAAGTITFSPSVNDVLTPQHVTLLYGTTGGIDTNRLDAGHPVTLMIGPGISFSPTPDKATIAEDSAATPIDVLANDTFNSPAATPQATTLQIVSTTQPQHGSVHLVEGKLFYTPAVNFNGTDTFTYAARALSGGIVTDPATAAVIITVTPVNDAPTIVLGTAEIHANDESGPQAVERWAVLSAGPDNERDQSLIVDTSTDRPELFTALPTIDATGRLTYTPAPNATGIAHVSVVVHDDGGTADGGMDTSIVQSFVIAIAKLHPLHNAADPLDASGDASISPLDALSVINYLNSAGPGTVPPDAPPSQQFLDVNGDGFISAIDPLTVINYLNARAAPATNVPPSNAVPSNALPPTAVPPNAPQAEVPTSSPESGTLPDMLLLLATDVAEQATRRRPR